MAAPRKLTRNDGWRVHRYVVEDEHGGRRSGRDVRGNHSGIADGWDDRAELHWDHDPSKRQLYGDVQRHQHDGGFAAQHHFRREDHANSNGGAG